MTTFDPERWLRTVERRVPRSVYGRQLAHALACHADADGGISAANTWLAHVSGLDPVQAHAGRATLVDAGLLVRATPPPGFPPRRNYYFLTFDAQGAASHHDHHHYTAA